MKVHGREIGMLKTVDAVCTIEEACPEKNLKNIRALFQAETYAEKVKAFSVIICALNKGYEEAMKYEDENYIPHPLTEQELKSLDDDTFMALFAEATRTFYSMDQTVEVEETKKKEEINETSD